MDFMEDVDVSYAAPHPQVTRRAFFEQVDGAVESSCRALVPAGPLIDATEEAYGEQAASWHRQSSEMPAEPKRSVDTPWDLRMMMESSRLVAGVQRRNAHWAIDESHIKPQGSGKFKHIREEQFSQSSSSGSPGVFKRKKVIPMLTEAAHNWSGEHMMPTSQWGDVCSSHQGRKALKHMREADNIAEEAEEHKGADENRFGHSSAAPPLKRRRPAVRFGSATGRLGSSQVPVQQVSFAPSRGWTSNPCAFGSPVYGAPQNASLPLSGMRQNALPSYPRGGYAIQQNTSPLYGVPPQGAMPTYGFSLPATSVMAM